MNTRRTCGTVSHHICRGAWSHGAVRKLRPDPSGQVWQWVSACHLGRRHSRCTFITVFWRRRGEGGETDVLSQVAATEKNTHSTRHRFELNGVSRGKAQINRHLSFIKRESRGRDRSY